MKQKTKRKPPLIPDFKAFAKAFPHGVPRGFGKTNLADDILWGRSTENAMLRRVIATIYHHENQKEGKANYDIRRSDEGTLGGKNDPPNF